MTQWSMNYYRHLIYLLGLLFLLGLGSCSSSKNLTNEDSKSRNIRSKTGEDEKMLRSDIVMESKRYLGVPYKYGGNTLAGIDCSGLTTEVYAKIGIALPRTSSSQATLGKEVSSSKVKEGDLAFFGSEGAVTHVAIVSKTEKSKVFVIHSTSIKGVTTTEILNDSYWKNILLGFRNVITQTL